MEKRNIAQWLPLAFSLPVVGLNWLPGAGFIALVLVPILLFFFGVAAVFFQGKGARLHSLIGLIAGYVLATTVVWFSFPKLN